MSFREKLRELLDLRDMRPSELARAAGISEAIVSMYLSGKKEPRAKTCNAISKVLCVSVDELLETGFDAAAAEPPVSTAGKRVGRLYDRADTRAREIVEVALKPFDLKYEYMPYIEPEAEICEEEKRLLPLHMLPASAGTGEFLDSNDFNMVEVGSDVPVSAHFGVRINGDSMEPKYPGGSVAWVRRASAVDIGQVGVFVLNRVGYIKKMGNGRLISLNPAYRPIELNEYDELKPCGLVVGVTDDIY